jgi:hypothetical protein
VDHRIAAAQRVHLVGHRPRFGHAGDVADDDCLPGRQRRPCCVGAIGVPGMENHLVTLLGQPPAGVQA